MTHAQETALSREETDAFIGRQETGVLSIAREDEPYAVPISYGYDATDQCFYLRLVKTGDSEKSRFLRATTEARIVVYEEEGDTYRSVVATGMLEAIGRDELTVEHVEQYGDAKRPLFEIWGEDKPELDIQLYQLTTDEVSGRLVEIERG